MGESSEEGPERLERAASHGGQKEKNYGKPEEEIKHPDLEPLLDAGKQGKGTISMRPEPAGLKGGERLAEQTETRRGGKGRPRSSSGSRISRSRSKT